MTMKMMIKTSSTSIIGVMLISDLGPPDPPTAIAIIKLLVLLMYLVSRGRCTLGCAPFLVLTISTLTPLDNMGVMTMKMMSITSITSTMGVTLMSATGGGALCLIIGFFLHFWLGPSGARPKARDHQLAESDRYFLTPERCDRFKK